MAAPKNLFTHQGVIFAFRIKGANNADSFGHCSWGLLILQGPALEVQKMQETFQVNHLTTNEKKTGSENLPNFPSIASLGSHPGRHRDGSFSGGNPAADSPAVVQGSGGQ